MHGVLSYLWQSSLNPCQCFAPPPRAPTLPRRTSAGRDKPLAESGFRILATGVNFDMMASADRNPVVCKNLPFCFRVQPPGSIDKQLVVVFPIIGVALKSI